MVGVRHHAMAVAHVGWTTVETALRTDPAFREAYEEAFEASTDELERAAFQRAKDRSDLLMIFLLKARRPLVYRERVEHMNIDPRDWTDRQLKAYNEGTPLRDVLALEEHTAELITAAVPPVTPPPTGGR